MLGNLFSLGCQICGAEMHDPELHRQWHEAMAEVIRQVIAPDMPMEEFQEIAVKAHGDAAAIREAERTVREESARETLERIRAERAAGSGKRPDDEA